MPAAILSQDILAICLLLADGHIDLSMEEVIHRIENFQEDQDRHFGITRSDFRGLFHYWFMFDLGIKAFDDRIDDIKLKDVVIDVLTYHDAYFNDEGEYWTKEKESWNEKMFMEEIKISDTILFQCSRPEKSS